MNQHTRPWLTFRTHFERNAPRPLPAIEDIDDAAGLPSRAQQRAALAAVLARFQLGEAGEGRIARDIDRVHLASIDDDYRCALKLFVKEEGRHARILGQIVEVLGGRLLRAGVSNVLFRWVRRLLGVRFKLVVLLVAEVVGGTIYQQLAGVMRQGSVRRALAQIADDERDHLAFHAAFLQGEWRSASTAALLRGGFWVVGLAAIVTVLAESRRDLPALGIALHLAAIDLWSGLRKADRAAFA
jgi:hypothetical protein